jgi:predicted DNA-binding protein with PD1-like motif
MPASKMALADLPEAYHMVHPGLVNPTRIDYVEIAEVISDHVILPAGESLHDAVIKAAKSLGGECGTASINGGKFSKTRFTTGGPAREGKSANYTFIRDVEEKEVLMGTCSFGFAEDAPHFVHCHARFVSDDSPTEMGGHLFSPDCIIDEPISAQMNVFIGASITKRASEETLHAIFEIDKHAPPQESDEYGREYFIRVHPNEDLPTALENFCQSQGIANAIISASLGSLNAPALSMRGDVQKISSVGTEAISFHGEVMTHENGPPKASILTNLVDEAGTEFCGYLIKDHAPVCITAEIYLMEVKDPAVLATMRQVRDVSY